MREFLRAYALVGERRVIVIAQRVTSVRACVCDRPARQTLATIVTHKKNGTYFLQMLK